MFVSGVKGVKVGGDVALQLRSGMILAIGLMWHKGII